MLRFVGCDVHKRTAVFTILLEDGTVLASYTVKGAGAQIEEPKENATTQLTQS